MRLKLLAAQLILLHVLVTEGNDFNCTLDVALAISLVHIYDASYPGGNQ